MKRCRSIVTAAVLALLLLPTLASASWYSDCAAKSPSSYSCREANNADNICCRNTYDGCHSGDCLSLYIGCVTATARAYAECEPPASQGQSLSFLPEKERERAEALLVAIELLKLAVPADQPATDPDEK